VLEEDQQVEEIIARVAACDIGKAEVVCCVRLPHPTRPGRRLQEVRTFRTMTRALLIMVDRLAELGVTRVVMEATSDYWKPVFYLLEARGWSRGWSTPATSNTCPAGPRPTGWTRSGCARSPSGA
jgi:transposase